MLRRLQIQNYALIEQLDLSWKSGMTAMTGETGSGKSIVLGAVGLILGHRCDASSVRSGAEKCIVEGVFSSNHRATAWLNSHELEVWDEIIIRREVNASGRSRAFVNDTPVTANDLRELGGMLVDLHGQDSTSLLLSRKYQLSWLDEQGGLQHAAAQYKTAFESFQTAQHALAQIELEKSKPQADLDYIHYQLNELELLNLENTDWGALQMELQTLENSTELTALMESAWSNLTDSSQDNSAADRVEYARKQLERAQSLSGQFNALYERLHALRIELNDVITELDDAKDSISIDPERLAKLQTQSDALQRILHKHNAMEVADLILLEKSLREQIDRAADIDQMHQMARKELEIARATVLNYGEDLMGKRQQTADGLTLQITQLLQQLNMPDAILHFELTAGGDMDVHGIETVRILFTANNGQPQMDLQKVASGGEKSRLMLAFKAVSSGPLAPPCIVLDEIDTGVSGSVASQMAQMMKSMTQDQQVIAVTHLPQVAAAAHQHISVRKERSDKATITQVTQLHDHERVLEIAALLSGAEVSEAAIENAQALMGS